MVNKVQTKNQYEHAIIDIHSILGRSKITRDQTIKIMVLLQENLWLDTV